MNGAAWYALGKGDNMKTYLPLNLQLFADEAPETPPEAPAAPSFDDALKANKDYQSEFDRRVTKALETAKAKWAEEEAAKLAEARTEAEKLARMNAEEKAKHESEKREKELRDREAALSLRELKAAAASTLAEKGLPNELLNSLSYTDAESCNKSIEAVEAAFRAAVQAGVEDRLKGKETPKTGGAVLPAPEKMTYAERAALYQTDKAAYEKAFGGK